LILKSRGQVILKRLKFGLKKQQPTDGMIADLNIWCPVLQELKLMNPDLTNILTNNRRSLQKPYKTIHLNHMPRSCKYPNNRGSLGKLKLIQNGPLRRIFKKT
jgi:hypothetical protein